MLFDLDVPNQVQFAVGVGMQQVLYVLTFILRLSFRRGANRCKFLAPRESRDMTVPIGISVTAAISW